MVIITFVMQRNAVEFQERILNLIAGCSQPAVKRDTLHSFGPTNIYAIALLHVAEVGGVVALGRVRHDRRLHVSNKRPLRSAEEGMGFDVGRAGPGTQSSVLILDQQLSNKRFTQTVEGTLVDVE